MLKRCGAASTARAAAMVLVPLVMPAGIAGALALYDHDVVVPTGRDVSVTVVGLPAAVDAGPGSKGASRNLCFGVAWRRSGGCSLGSRLDLEWSRAGHHAQIGPCA